MSRPSVATRLGNIDCSTPWPARPSLPPGRPGGFAAGLRRGAFLPAARSNFPAPLFAPARAGALFFVGGGRLHDGHCRNRH